MDIFHDAVTGTFMLLVVVSVIGLFCSSIARLHNLWYKRKRIARARARGNLWLRDLQ